jgi:hypothetical protein
VFASSSISNSDIIDDLVAIADVDRHVLGEAKGDTGAKLVGKAPVIIVNKGVLAPASCFDSKIEVQPAKADTAADLTAFLFIPLQMSCAQSL